MSDIFKSQRRRITSVVFITLGILLVFASNAKAIEIVISDNGAGSDNEVSVEVTQETTVEQTNEANVENEVDIDSNTGGNETSGNTGDDVVIVTGDVESEVFVENSLNQSSVDAECCLPDLNSEISGNGAYSDNSIELEVNQETNITIDQKADVSNEIDGNANTGENTANLNSGDVTIKTGDIKVSGGIVSGLINSANVSGSSGGGSVNVNISGNGEGSNNKISASFNDPTDIQLNHTANIRNSVYWDLNTGGNSANGNLGDVQILTGNILFDFFVKNGPVNFGGVDWQCCDGVNPQDPGDGVPGPADGDNGDPSSTPPGVGGNSGDDSGGGDGGDSGGNSAGDGPQVLGLSDTSSKAAKALIFWVGMAMMIFGFKTISSEVKISAAKKITK
jgi:hypothetical protein